MALHSGLPSVRFLSGILPVRRRHGAERKPILRTLRISRNLVFAAAVAIPTSASSIYYGLIASDRFVSESKFVIRGTSSRRSSGFDFILQIFGGSRSLDDSNAVQNYLLSRDAVKELESMVPVREIYSKRNIDLLSRFPWPWRNTSFESLYDYYITRISVLQEGSKGISTLKVQAFTPHEAKAISDALLKLAERFVNQMNVRAQGDAVRFSTIELMQAEDNLLEAQRKLTEFRSSERLVDPRKDSEAALQTITTLSTEMAQTMVQISEITKVSPENPSLPSLRAKVDAMRAQVDSERRKLAGADTTLAPKLAMYEQIVLAKALAERRLSSASTAVDAARLEARRQSIYLEEVVRPNLPDESTVPERLRAITTSFALSLFLAAMGWLIVAGAKEHVIE